MKKLQPLHAARHAAIALPFALASVFADGQTYTDASTYSPSMSSPASQGYIGINLGAPRYDDQGCSALFNCDDPDLGWNVYAGKMFNSIFGVELGYIDLDRQKRNGGASEAYGVNVSLVGSIPLDKVSFFGKVGSTYGWTKTNAAVGPVGDKNGWGLSYGAGVGFDITRRTELLLEWDRHRLDFTGANDNDVDMTSIGLKYQF